VKYKIWDSWKFWTHVVVLVEFQSRLRWRVYNLNILTSILIDYLLNLSILLSRGNERNFDFNSTGEGIWTVQSRMNLDLKVKDMYLSKGWTVYRIYYLLSYLNRKVVYKKWKACKWRFIFVILRQESPPSRLVWDCKLNPGGRCLLNIIITEIPIENKYCEGKVKRPLKREWKEREIVLGKT